MEKILVIGGGGHAKVLMEAIRLSGTYDLAGILDDRLEAGTAVAGVSVLGGDELISSLWEVGIRNACIGIGSVRDNGKRSMLYGKVKSLGYSMPAIIHPRSVFSSEVSLSAAVQVMAGAIIQAGVFIGENTIINTGSIIEHDCIIGSHVHAASGVVMAGGCVLGDGVFVGAGAVIKQGIRIGDAAVVAAGAVVIDDVAAGAVVKGVPAK